MPAAYTHYTYGEAVLQQLPHMPIKDKLLQYKDLFYIGLHGPDILFYYKALQSNAINRLGNEMHYVPARSFFEKGLQLAHSIESPDATLAYLCGFICHLALDHACHSYVEHCVRTTPYSHTDVETYLDRSYLLDDGHNPLTRNITAHILPSSRAGEVIAPLFDQWGTVNVSPEELVQSLKQMKTYNQLLLPTNPVKEGLIRLALKLAGKYDSLQGLIMKHGCDAPAQRMVDRLRQLLQEAVPQGVSMIEHFVHCYESGQPLDERFDYHFSYTEEKIAEYVKETNT